MSAPMSTPLSVSELLHTVKGTLERNYAELSVEGEISNFTRHFKSGHLYFTLKDIDAQIPCVFFKGMASYCSFEPKDGQKVIVQADLSLYPQQGRIQLIVKSMRPAGLGTLQQQFDALKEKLRLEGLFDSSRKRPIPTYPEHVGIITSATGAVIQDIQKTFLRRAPWINLYLIPVHVQGSSAAPEIVHALERWNAPDSPYPSVDVLIVGRGGGSLEDLWAFNEEIVARAIAASRIPVISAVGHESDVTIADFVADKTASTPTAAAEFASPDTAGLLAYLDHTRTAMGRKVQQSLDYCALQIRQYARGPLSLHPSQLLKDYLLTLDQLDKQLHDALDASLTQAKQLYNTYGLHLLKHNPESQVTLAKQQLSSLESTLLRQTHHQWDALTTRVHTLEKLLTSLSPASALQRGYAIITTPDGKLISQTKSLKKGTSLHILTRQADISATVTDSSPPSFDKLTPL